MLKVFLHLLLGQVNPLVRVTLPAQRNEGRGGWTRVADALTRFSNNFRKIQCLGHVYRTIVLTIDPSGPMLQVGWQPKRKMKIAAFCYKKVAKNPEPAARRAIPDPILRQQTLNDPEAGPLLRANLLSTMERMEDRLAGTRNDIIQSRLPLAYPVARIRAPVLIVHGTADEALPFGQPESLAARLPRGELLAIPGGQHASLFTHCRLIRARIEPFPQLHWPTETLRCEPNVHGICKDIRTSL